MTQLSRITNRPVCSDFIIAAIRKERSNRTNMKPGTASGVALHRIFSMAREVYSNQEFRESLQTLIKNDVVILMAQTCEVRSEDSYRFWVRQKIVHIPPRAPLIEHCWRLDSEGEPVNDRAARSPKTFCGLILYVTVDGLPATIAGTITENGMTKAEQIVASVHRS
jgi:hypothetical protein